MPEYSYNQTELYTLASQLSRVVEKDPSTLSYIINISVGLRAAYDAGIKLNVTESLMIQAWKLLILKEICDEFKNKRLSTFLLETKLKPFMDSIDNLGIRQIVRNELNYETRS